jgi:osmoprotectant transport system substrate-binding protein
VQASGDLDKKVAALRDPGAKVGLTFGKPSQAANQNAFGVTRRCSAARGSSRRTGSKSVDSCPSMRGGPETKNALTGRSISIGLVFSSDSAVAAG